MASENEKKIGPDHRDALPGRIERRDCPKGGGGEIEAHQRAENLGLIGSRDGDVQELGKDRCGRDAVAERDRHQQDGDEQEVGAH